MTEELVASLRSFTRDLRPPALDDLGAVASIRRLLDHLEARSGIQWDMKVKGTQRRLHRDTELGLYRIAQEAIRNVERHAQATAIWVNLSFHPNTVALQVRDNGKGFAWPQPKAGPNSGLGLIGIQERATHLAGAVVVESAPGQGAVISATIPVR